MENRIAILDSLLTDEDREQLSDIYEPREVLAPASDAYRSLCVMPDGEIRCYGGISRASEPDASRRPVYHASRDCGLSWKLHYADPDALGCAVQGQSGRWLALKYDSDGKLCVRLCDDTAACDSHSFREIELPVSLNPCRLPMQLSSGRWLIAGEYDGHSAVLLSDDDGESWRVVDILKTGRFELKPPHLGPRWENSGLEPTVVELPDRLVMVLRTSRDNHYSCYSEDGGDSWTKPRRTFFHSTLTNPCLLKLHDGRIVFFWNNTRPLPEQDKRKVTPPLSEDEINGVWEDVFTNRDANCVAISDDNMRSWRGFRELCLNRLRNDCDFRSSGAMGSSRDKSVHQFQAIELPHGKIMVHVGQHELLTRVYIFDINWLYEKSRSEDFRYGLGNLSTQVYVKSLSGGYRGFTGHCAWNRTNGALLVPDPVGDFTEALLLRNVDDDRLYNQLQGMVWNFPAARRGVVRLRCAIGKGGLKISLADHWINPTDPTVLMWAQFGFMLRGNGVMTDYTIMFDTKAGIARLATEEQTVAIARLSADAPYGLCYLHIQTASMSGDSEGSLIKSFSMTSE